MSHGRICPPFLASNTFGGMKPFVVVILVLLGGCAPGAASGEVIVLASTTSTQDSGLLDVLTAEFEKAHPGHAVKVVAVGSGEALDLGRRGDADVLLAHSPKDEAKFIAQGHGVSRTTIMKNNFVIAGPRGDPSSIAKIGDAVSAFREIAGSGARFISRGDESGTHRRELSLWEEAAIALKGDWYFEAGSGMAETLVIAAEKGAYILTDTATLRATQSPLAILLSGDDTLINPYSVIPVVATRSRGAPVLAQWLVSPQARSVIGAFGKDRFGSSLFEPVGP